MPDSLPPSVGLLPRLKRAIRYLEFEGGDRVSQSVLGDMVAAELRREAPFTQAAVYKWMKNGTTDVDVLWALSRVCSVSFIWLLTGEGPMSARPGASLDDEIALNPAPLTPADEGVRRLREEGLGAPDTTKRPAAGGARRRRPRGG